jgi:Rrf2 family protein
VADFIWETPFSKRRPRCKLVKRLRFFDRVAKTQMIFQHSSELAIRTALFLAEQAPGKLSSVRQIAAYCQVSETYLAKIIQRLAAAGLIRSFRGAGKGVELGRPADRITVSSLVHAVQDPLPLDRCVLGLGACSDVHPCALHHEWLPLATGIRCLLDKTTLADLAGSVARGSSDVPAPAGAATGEALIQKMLNRFPGGKSS